MLTARQLNRKFAWKKVLEIPGYEKAINRKKYIGWAKTIGSAITTSCFFITEWYTLSTFGSMFTAILYANRYRNPLFNKLVLSIEVDTEDKTLARIKTLDGTYRLNIDTVTSLTDIYPAYRALQSAKEIFDAQDQKIAQFDGDSQNNLSEVIKALENARDDIVGHLVSINEGRTIPYHEYADRFHFFFRQGNEVFAVGFPFTPAVEFDPEELMRVLSGNKPLKPRRSVLLAKQDEQDSLEAQEKLRLKLKSEPLQELPTQGKTELPNSPS